jgi:hypothetical protein
MNRRERRRAAKVGDVVDVRIGVRQTKGNETLVCYACDRPAEVLRDADDSSVYGFAIINGGKPVPLCVACLSSNNANGVVRKFLNAPDLKISDGGKKTTEQVCQIADALAESTDSAHH